MDLLLALADPGLDLRPKGTAELPVRVLTSPDLDMAVDRLVSGAVTNVNCSKLLLALHHVYWRLRRSPQPLTCPGVYAGQMMCSHLAREEGPTGELLRMQVMLRGMDPAFSEVSAGGKADDWVAGVSTVTARGECAAGAEELAERRMIRGSHIKAGAVREVDVGGVRVQCKMVEDGWYECTTPPFKGLRFSSSLGSCEPDFDHPDCRRCVLCEGNFEGTICPDCHTPR
jgi:hypothetical protein